MQWPTASTSPPIHIAGIPKWTSAAVPPHLVQRPGGSQKQRAKLEGLSQNGMYENHEDPPRVPHFGSSHVRQHILASASECNLLIEPGYLVINYRLGWGQIHTTTQAKSKHHPRRRPERSIHKTNHPTQGRTEKGRRERGRGTGKQGGEEANRGSQPAAAAASRHASKHRSRGASKRGPGK